MADASRGLDDFIRAYVGLVKPAMRGSWPRNIQTSWGSQISSSCRTRPPKSTQSRSPPPHTPLTQTTNGALQVMGTSPGSSADLTSNIDNGEWREPVTMDESLLEVHQQLDEVLSHIHQLPHNFASNTSTAGCNDSLATWTGLGDPCNSSWTGVTCSGGNVTAISISLASPRLSCLEFSLPRGDPSLAQPWKKLEHTGRDGVSVTNRAHNVYNY